MARTWAGIRAHRTRLPQPQPLSARDIHTTLLAWHSYYAALTPCWPQCPLARQLRSGRVAANIGWAGSQRPHMRCWRAPHGGGRATSLDYQAAKAANGVHR